MSRAAARASGEARRFRRELARLDALRARHEAYLFQNAMLAACEGCGLSQVQPPGPVIMYEGAEPAGTVCVLCGCPTARYLEHLTRA